MTIWGCNGVVATDTVTIGSFVVKKQTFDQYIDSRCTVYDNTFGASCVDDTIANMKYVFPNMYKQGRIPQPMFGLYLNS